MLGLDLRLKAMGFGQVNLGRQKAMREGEGNGNPLQYSCLENPMDGDTW